ncbi:AAA family ATPase [Massilia sp. Root418]|uniref:AAA family ATPase n=1 Tax=Massilia sp. Root418 TaxID=1736532 RepID=UPI0009E9E131|nr:ATP-binding protein [Massilia sp. Root418]
MKMKKIESVHMKGFRQFDSLDVYFNDKFNFIAGPNGCGKTSILTAISHCFSTQGHTHSRFSKDVEFWTDIAYNNALFRVGLGPDSFSKLAYRENTVRQWSRPLKIDGRNAVAPTNAPEEIPDFVPLFIGAQRSISYRQIAGLKREDNQEKNKVNYRNQAVKSLYGEWDQDVKQWMVNRYFIIDKDWAKEEAQNWEHLIMMLPSIGPLDSEFQYLRTERELEPIFKLYGKECYLEELSAGFQAILLIIANIFIWVEGTNVEGSRSVKNATGTVLIDELDVHLHPEWQFNIRSGLAAIFPNLQFIVTTHSPHLLSTANPGEVIRMPSSRYLHECKVLRPDVRSFAGWSTDQILSEIMDVKSLDNKLHERLIANALEQVEQSNAKGLQVAIEALKQISHPNDTVIVALTARLATLQAAADD